MVVVFEAKNQGIIWELENDLTIIMFIFTGKTFLVNGLCICISVMELDVCLFIVFINAHEEHTT